MRRTYVPLAGRGACNASLDFDAVIRFGTIGPPRSRRPSRLRSFSMIPFTAVSTPGAAFLTIVSPRASRRCYRRCRGGQLTLSSRRFRRLRAVLRRARRCNFCRTGPPAPAPLLAVGPALALVSSTGSPNFYELRNRSFVRRWASPRAPCVPSASPVAARAGASRTSITTSGAWGGELSPVIGEPG